MVKGSCQCSQLTYEFEGEPAAHVACHCTNCRKSSGTTKSYNLIIPNDKFKHSGALKTYTRKGASGASVKYNSCDTCAGLVFVEAEAMKDIKILKMGTVDDEEFLNKLGNPKAEIYCDRMFDWEQKIPGADHKGEQ